MKTSVPLTNYVLRMFLCHTFSNYCCSILIIELVLKIYVENHMIYLCNYLISVNLLFQSSSVCFWLSLHGLIETFSSHLLNIFRCLDVRSINITFRECVWLQIAFFMYQDLNNMCTRKQDGMLVLMGILTHT